MEKVYAFTNENLTCLKDIYDFNGSRVLTVLGSADQYFSSILFGAQRVDVYDINPNTWDYFLFKFWGLRLFSYDEFFKYFVETRLNDRVLFERLRRHLSYSTLEKLEKEVFSKGKKLSSFLELCDVTYPSYDRGDIIPYFSKDNFYKLKSIVKDSNFILPEFYNSYLEDLPEELNLKEYDILLASNIFFWMYMSNEASRVGEFKELLLKFNARNMEALYGYLHPTIREAFLSHGFVIDDVESANSFRLDRDSVVTLRKVINIGDE